MLVFSGFGEIITSFMGGHNANISGPIIAITSSEEAGDDEDSRYAAPVVGGLLFGGFGIIAAAATSIINAVPGALISLLVGVAMISVLISSFKQSWAASERYRYGTFFALIRMSGISLFDIGAPFWSLIGGVVISATFKTEDWSFVDGGAMV